ncbi:MAG: PorV/PorQ family protein [Elusimicrobia bacterium]|nr:PorV/PorQ family protein [Elusimicrobiota bacterium]
MAKSIWGVTPARSWPAEAPKGASVALLLAAALFAAPARAAESGGQPGAMLQYGVGARALGMGGAFFAIADDATAAYWNPAGLAYLQRKEFTTMQAALFEQTSFNYFAYAHPTTTKGTFALGMTQLSSTGFEKVNATFDPATGEATSITKAGSFADTQRAIAFSWGRQATDTMSFGLSVKQLARQLDTSSDSMLGLDIAAMRVMGPNYKLALGVQNVFSKTSGDTADRLPVIVKLGNSVQAFKDRLILGFDLQKSQSADLNWRFGGEYWAARWFAFRFGILAAPQIQETDFGFGLRFRRLQFDLAQGIHDLGASTRMSVTFRFGRSRDDRSEDQIKAMIQAGFQAFRDGDFQLATLRLNQALDAAPSNKQVKAMLSRLQTVVGFIPQATGGEEFQTYVRKGVIDYVDGRDLKSSVNALRYAYNKNPKDDKLLSLLNLVEREAGVTELTRRVEGPENFTFVDQKLYDARQAIYDGKYDLAIRRAQDVLDLEPSNVTSLEIMGSAFFLMDEKAKAKAVWKRVLEIDPKDKVVAEFLKQVQ